MIQRVLFFLIVFFPAIGISQLTDKNAEILRQELATRINDLRISKGVQPLIFSDTLKEAAEFHSDYMASKRTLTHNQRQRKYRTPEERVEEFGGTDFKTIGENVLSSSSQSFPIKRKNIALLADEMFEGWKNSPRHYTNMVNAEFVFGDLGFQVDLRNKVVYATHVFGSRGSEIEGQISTDSFGIRKASRHCYNEYSEFAHVILNLGNLLRIEGNEVVLYHHSISSFQKIFSSNNDGIAVDLISKDQFACGSPNKLHASPIHNGILLAPTYRNEMLANNRALSDYRVITKVVDILEHLSGSNYSPAFVLIKNKRACQYIYPSFVPKKDYQPLHVEPIVKDEASVHFVSEGITHTQFIQYDFERNLTTPVTLPSIKKRNQKIHSVHIKSFSSVEGDSTYNIYLHNARANFVQQHLRSTLNVPTSSFSSEVMENWEEMDFQLNYFNRSDLAELSRDSIKAILYLKDDSLPWDSLLFIQRKSFAVVNYYDKYNPAYSHESFQEFNLRTAVATENTSLANKALYAMYLSQDYNRKILFEPQIINFFKQQKETFANYAALLSRDFSYDPYQVSEFLHSWLERTDQLSADAEYNLLYLYTLIGTYLLDNWDVSAERLSNVIHPKKIKKISSSHLTPELMLNLHLTFINYYGQVNDQPNIHKSFNYISDYFKTNSLKEDDDIKLALFFNYWSMYQSTIQHLLPRFRSNKLNENGLFILAYTMNFSNYDDESTVMEVHRKALETNPAKWCEWFTRDFQTLRNYKIKQLYCDSCE